MSKHSPAPPAPLRGHRVQELVCAYRPLRSRDGRVIDVPTLDLGNARIAASVFTQLLAGEPVEVFGVACLSTKHRLLAWHVLSRGTRASTLVSMPDVFVPACLTPGTTTVMVVHNHPSGDPSPSPDDVQVTRMIVEAGSLLNIDVLDHVIIGRQRFVSMKERGLGFK